MAIPIFINKDLVGIMAYGNYGYYKWNLSPKHNHWISNLLQIIACISIHQPGGSIF
jgi:hypothetical protein